MGHVSENWDSISIMDRLSSKQHSHIYDIPEGMVYACASVVNGTLNKPPLLNIGMVYSTSPDSIYHALSRSSKQQQMDPSAHGLITREQARPCLHEVLALMVQYGYTVTE